MKPSNVMVLYLNSDRTFSGEMKKLILLKSKCDKYRVDSDTFDTFDYLSTTMEAVDFDPCAAP